MTNKGKIMTAILGLITLAFVIGTIAIVVMGVNAKTKTESVKKYENYTNNIISYEETLSQEEYIYYVMIYRDNCTGCSKIEETVCDYIENYKNGSTYKIYLLSTDTCENKIVEFDSNGDAISNLYVSVATDLRVSATPTMVMVQGGIIISAQIGASAIVRQLSSR